MQLYVLTTGGREDYEILGTFIGPEGLDLEGLARQWALEFPEKTTKLSDPKSGPEYFDSAHFREFVCDRAHLVEVPYDEVYLPDYSLDMKKIVGV